MNQNVDCFKRPPIWYKYVKSNREEQMTSYYIYLFYFSFYALLPAHTDVSSSLFVKEYYLHLEIYRIAYSQGSDL